MKAVNILCRIVYTILQWTYGIIQNITGLIILIRLHIKDKSTKSYYYHGAIVTKWRDGTSMGMGMFVFMGRDNPGVLVHEYGHTVQSVITGPLYLLVVGLPSAIWCNAEKFRTLRREKNVRYTSFYCEAWANHLGRLVLHQEPIND